MFMTYGGQTSQVADPLHRVRGTLDHDELDAVREGPLQARGPVGAVHGHVLDGDAGLLRALGE